MNLYLIKYNNYYNRILKRLHTIADYILDKTIPDDYVKQEAVSFNPNDGVSATQVVNFDASSFDYLIAVNTTKSGDTYVEGDINSRWFIIEAVRNRSGQYTLRLQRDLLADYYDAIKDAPAFIERGMLQNDDPMVFNAEGISYNQIKTEEYPLYDGSNCLWIVGYVPRKMTDPNDPDNTEMLQDVELTADVSSSNASPDATFTDAADLLAREPDLYHMIFGDKVYYQYDINDLDVVIKNVTFRKQADLISGPMYDVTSYHLNAAKMYDPEDLFKAGGTFNTSYKTDIKESGNFRFETSVFIDPKYGFDSFAKQYRKSANYTNIQDIEEDLGIYENVDYLDVINTWNGKAIKVGNDVYTIKESEPYQHKIEDKVATESKSNICSNLRQAFIDFNAIGSNTMEFATSSGNYMPAPAVTDLDDMTINLGINTTVRRLYKTKLNVQAKVLIPNNNSREHCVDSQYDMFAIPWEVSSRCNNNGLFSLGSHYSRRVVPAGTQIPPNVRTGDIDPAAGLAIAQQFAITMGNGNLYDLQILPYCPIEGACGYTKKTRGAQDVYGEDWLLDLTDITHRLDIQPITINNSTVSYMFWCGKSSFHQTLHNKRINYLTVGGGLTLATSDPVWKITGTDNKTASVTEKYRLTGGNYASMFDFTPGMNDGIETMELYYDYKPYQPFIKVNPTFNYLYGKEFKDCVGLILSGDFSLSIMTDVWTNYKLNNKNYQASFDNNILTQETKFYNSFTGSKMSAITGMMTSAVSAAAGLGRTDKEGGMTTGAASMIAQGYNFALSAANTGYGLAATEENQSISIENQKQQFAYQLDNIKAIPQTIQKVSSLTQVNKVVPLLEYYVCTPTEQSAFDNYIKYNGMTVGRIDTIANIHAGNEDDYIQGRFIRLPDIEDDYHIATELNRTFQAGFYNTIPNLPVPR